MFVFIAANDAAPRELHADILKIYESALQSSVGADMSRGCVVDRERGQSKVGGANLRFYDEIDDNDNLDNRRFMAV